MKKYFLGFYIMINGVALQAQIGINTKNPLSSLHVKEKRNGNTINDINSSDGLLIPKLTKAELASKSTSTYNSNSLYGTLVFVSDVSGTISGPSVSKVININAPGFYYLNAQSIWIPTAGNNLDLTEDSWINNPTNNRIELGYTTKGVARASATEVIITDNGNLGINELNPVKRFDLNAANGTNSTDFIKIINLTNPPSNTKINSLQIDNVGNVSRRADDNIEGEILRLPLAAITNIQNNAPKFLTTEVNSNNAPNSTPNKITTINGFGENSISEFVLQPGLYKYDVKIIGYFDVASPYNSVSLTTFVNNQKYSINYFGSNTKIGSTGNGTQHYSNFISSDFLEITTASTIKFQIANYVNSFTQVGYVNIGGNRSYRSVILIQRIK